MKNNFIILGLVIIGGFLIYKKMKKDSTLNGRELAPPPTNELKPSVSPIGGGANVSPKPK